MKKIALLLLLMPTFIMVISGAANAQRKNTTSHNLIKPIENNISDTNEEKMDNKKKEENCKCDCDCHKKHKKKHHRERKKKIDK